MTEFIWPIIGGICIGLSASLLLLCSGRIAGISGIVWQCINNSFTSNNLWRGLFLIGLLLGTFCWHFFSGAPIPAIENNYLLASVAGLLVGVGVKVGSGCTSGHGVCGMGRLSIRSTVATITFMFTAILTVFAFNLVAG